MTMSIVICACGSVVGFCQCSQKIQQKRYSYIKNGRNLEDTISKHRNQPIEKMDSVAIEIFPMIVSRRRSC